MKLKLSLAKEFGGEALTFYDIAEDRDYLTALHRIYELLLPNSTAKPIPLTGVFVDDRLRLVIVGYCDVDKLRELLSRVGSRVVVYRLGEEWSVGERVASELSKLFSNLREPLRLKLWSRFTGCCQ